MDLWIVAAAAGAGYLSQFYQNISQNREGSSGIPSGSSIRDNSKSPALIQQTGESRNGNHSDGMFAETSQGDDSAPAEVAPTSALEPKKQEETMLSSSIIPPEFRKSEKLEDRGGCMVDLDVGEIPEYPGWEMLALYGPHRSKSSLRSKPAHLQFIKPRSSLDSCLMAQMYGEEAGIEDYLLSPLVSHCTPTVGPFIVSDGRRVISRSTVGCGNGQHKVVHSKANDAVIGIPALPKSRGADYSKLKLDKGKRQTGKSSSTCKSVNYDSQGSASGQVFFSFGISVGIIMTIIANKLEVEKLKDSLKHTENLVQDLQEELEMKDSLTVKELANDDDSQDTHKNWCGNQKLTMLSRQFDTTLIKCNDQESVDQKETKSISKIEAELEEELERLEQSMRGSALRGRSSDDIEFEQELDEDIVAELVHGELTANIIRQRSSSEASRDRDSSSPSTPLSAKEGISPHDLCLRLHDVIRSRLEERIKELEAELTKSQRRVQHLESERIISWRDVSNSESSSTLGSPITIEAHSPMARSLVLNSSGDALDAYNETYEELDKKRSLTASSKVCTENQQHNQNGCRDCTMTSAHVEGKKHLSNGREMIPSNMSSPKGYRGKDDVDDLLLIKQIVQKARQGSPAVLRAQRALVYLNKDGD